MAPNWFHKQLLLTFKQLKKISNAKPAPKTNGDSGDSVSEVIDDDGCMANGTAAHVEKLVEESAMVKHIKSLIKVCTFFLGLKCSIFLMILHVLLI